MGPLRSLQQELIIITKHPDDFRNETNKLPLDEAPPHVPSFVGSLDMFPLKGGAAMQGLDASGAHPLKAARIGRTGLCLADSFVRDRMIAIVTLQPGNQGENRWDVKRFSGKENGRIVRVRTFHDRAGDTLIIKRPGDERGIAVTADMLHEADDRIVTANFSDELIKGMLQTHGTIIDYLRPFLESAGAPSGQLALFLPHDGFHRRLDERDTENMDCATELSDGAHVHVVRLDTTRRIGALIGQTIDPRCLRANIGLDARDGGMPFLEYFYPGGVVCTTKGPARLHARRRTARCAVPGQDTETGEKSPAGAGFLSFIGLRSPRRVEEQPKHKDSPSYGYNADFSADAVGLEIAVGDEVVLEPFGG